MCTLLLALWLTQLGRLLTLVSALVSGGDLEPMSLGPLLSGQVGCALQRARGPTRRRASIWKVRGTWLQGCLALRRCWAGHART
jgi:hypothetical protein